MQVGCAAWRYNRSTFRQCANKVWWESPSVCPASHWDERHEKRAQLLHFKLYRMRRGLQRTSCEHCIAMVTARHACSLQVACSVAWGCLSAHCLQNTAYAPSIAGLTLRRKENKDIGSSSPCSYSYSSRHPHPSPLPPPAPLLSLNCFSYRMRCTSSDQGQA